MDITKLAQRIEAGKPDESWADGAEVEGYAKCCIQVALELLELDLIESVALFMIQCGYEEDSCFVIPGIYYPSEEN